MFNKTKRNKIQFRQFISKPVQGQFMQMLNNHEFKSKLQILIQFYKIIMKEKLYHTTCTYIYKTLTIHY